MRYTSAPTRGAKLDERVVLWVPVTRICLLCCITFAAKDVALACCAPVAASNKWRFSAVTADEAEMHRISASHGLDPTSAGRCLLLQLARLLLLLNLFQCVSLLRKADASEVLHIVDLQLEPACRASMPSCEPPADAGFVEDVAAAEHEDRRPFLCHRFSTDNAEVTPVCSLS